MINLRGTILFMALSAVTFSISADQEFKKDLIFKEKNKLYAKVALLNPNVIVKKNVASDFNNSPALLMVNAPKYADGKKTAAFVQYFPLRGKAVPNTTYEGELWAKCVKGQGSVIFYLEGRAGGKHYYRRRFFTLDAKWKKLTISENMPENIVGLKLRVDCEMGADYELTLPKLIQAANQKPEISAPKGNLVLNGGAERDWYQTGISSVRNSIVAEKFVELQKKVIHKSLGPAPKAIETWSIDKNEKHSGNASFKVKVPKGTQKGVAILFNPIPLGPPSSERDTSKSCPYKIGGQVNLSLWAKAERKGKATLSLFVGPGVAYAKDVELTTEWEKYELIIPCWGKNIKGVKKYGDTQNAHSMRLGVVQPRFVVREKNTTVWLDDVKCWLGKDVEPPETDGLYLKGWVTNNNYHYFRRGELVKLKFKIDNATDIKKQLKISYSLIDYFGHKFHQSAGQIVDLKAKGEFDKDYDITPERNGLVTISFQVEDLSDGSHYSQNCLVGIIGAKSPIWPQLGVNIATPSDMDENLKFIKDFGIGSVRAWARGIGDKDKYIGSYDLKKYKEAGIYVLFCLNKLIPSTYKLLIPTDLKPFLKTLEFNAQLNKGLIDSYEILNEPNIWAGKYKIDDPAKFRQVTPKIQTELIEACTKTIKSVDPNVKIAGPGAAHTGLAWIESVLACGGNKYLDIITEHPYRDNPEAPDYGKDLRRLKGIISQYYKKQVPIYASEAGRIMTSMPVNNLIDQNIRRSTSWNIRNMLTGFSNGLQKYFHFQLNTRMHGTQWNLNWQGNPRNEFKMVPNTCFHVMYWIGQFIGNAKALGEIDLGDPVRCHVFQKKENQHVSVIWKWNELDKESIMTLDNSLSIEAFDMFGNPCGEKENGNLKLCLTPDPLYLVTNSSFAELTSVLTSAGITGLGFPARLSLNFNSCDNFELIVTNISAKPINGSCEILKPGIVQKHEALIFKNIQPGKNATFALVRAPGKEYSLPVRTKVDDADELGEIKLNLQVIMVPESQDIKIDGDLSDWPKQTPRALNYADARSNRDQNILTEWVKKENIKAEVYTAWNKNALYLAIVVQKKKNNFPVKPSSMYNFDSVQIAFDPLKNPTTVKYGDDDYEYAIGLVNKLPTVYRFHYASVKYDGVIRVSGLNSEVKTAIKELDGKTIYEMEFPLSTISPFKLQKGNSMTFSSLINLNNGEKRVGWLELTPGVGQSPKCTKDFVTLFLAD